MKAKFAIPLAILIAGCMSSRDASKTITEDNVTRVIKTLSSDEMRGRYSLDPENIESATVFIENEFSSIGLQPLEGLNGVRQQFTSDMVDARAGKGKGIPMNNVVGVIPGNTKPDEIVLFSAHYDHIGIMHPVDGDSIANGADDDASGVTAVIELARHFKKQKHNSRTLVFVAFTGEEVGGYGSRYFSKQLDPDRIVAMFNIEMIGKPSKWGRNAAFITGYEKSDLGAILGWNAEGSGFSFNPDPYPQEQLFYRSDNATLARLGVPAHSISTDQIDIDTLYHSVHDEFETIDVMNLTTTIRAIANAARTIVDGTDTPTRVAPNP